MSKHTITPWVSAEGTTTTRMVIAPDATSKRKRVIARLGGPDSKANANFIAASPDLLAECEANLKPLFALREIYKSQGATNAADTIQNRIDKTRAAIAKAKGENE